MSDYRVFDYFGKPWVDPGAPMSARRYAVGARPMWPEDDYRGDNQWWSRDLTPPPQREVGEVQVWARWSPDPQFITDYDGYSHAVFIPVVSDPVGGIHVVYRAATQEDIDNPRVRSIHYEPGTLFPHPPPYQTASIHMRRQVSSASPVVDVDYQRNGWGSGVRTRAGGVVIAMLFYGLWDGTPSEADADWVGLSERRSDAPDGLERWLPGVLVKEVTEDGFYRVSNSPAIPDTDVWPDFYTVTLSLR